MLQTVYKILYFLYLKDVEKKLYFVSISEIIKDNEIKLNTRNSNNVLILPAV